MPGPEDIVVGSLDPVGGKVVAVPSHKAINEKDLEVSSIGAEKRKDGALDNEVIQTISPLDDSDNPEKESLDEDHIIITGADAGTYLLSLRDDFVPALTFRSLFLASGLSAFQATMSQIYSVS